MKLSPGIYGIPSTPYCADGHVALDQLETQVDFIIRAGAHGIAGPIIASGFMELSDNERKDFMKVTTETAAERVPVVLHVSGLSTVAAVDYAVYAETLGADAIIAMPPYLKRYVGEEIYNYFKAIAQAVSIPIVIQNSMDFMGTPISTPMIRRLLEDIENIQYVKEERMPSSHAITSIIDECKGLYTGIFGGFGGRELIGEMRRGIFGTMVACDVVDIQVRIFNMFHEGKIDEAIRLHHLLLPFINMKSLLGESAVKEMLVRRNAISSTFTRSGSANALDNYDREELDMYFKMLEPWFSI